MISAIIRPTALARLAASLRRARVGGITVSQVEGFGREHLNADVDLFGRLNPKSRVDVAVEDDDVDDIVKLITEAVGDGQRDSGGRIFVSELLVNHSIPGTSKES